MKISKILFVFVSLSLMLSFSACSDDDDKEIVNPIVGTWSFSSVVADEVELSDTYYKERIENLLEKRGESDFGSFTYIFTADNKVTLMDFDGSGVGTYTFEDGKLTIVWGEDDYDTYYVSFGNGVLYIYEDYLEMLNDLELIDFIDSSIRDLGLDYYKAVVKMTFVKQ